MSGRGGAANTTSRLRLYLSDSKIPLLGVQMIYAVALVIWIIITIVLNLWTATSKTTKVFLSLPIIVFLSNIMTPVESSTILLDPQVSQSSLLTYILIASSVLSPWLTVVIDRTRKGHVRVLKAFVVMLLALTLTQYDLFSLRYVSDLETHWMTSLNTYALALLGFCVSEFLHAEYTPSDFDWGIDKVALERTAERTILTAGAQLNVLGNLVGRS